MAGITRPVGLRESRFEHLEQEKAGISCRFFISATIVQLILAGITRPVGLCESQLEHLEQEKAGISCHIVILSAIK